MRHGVTFNKNNNKKINTVLIYIETLNFSSIYLVPNNEI